MDRKSGISIPMAPIDMSYIAHLIKEKTTDTFISTEMVSSYDHVKKEKGEKHERKIECKVTDNKDKRVEITLSSEGKTQSVTLNDKEAYFLSEFIKFTVPRVTGWETITRFSPPPARRNNNRMNTYNNNNNNAGNEQQQQQHSNYRNNNYNNNNNQGGRYNNNNAGNNRNNGGYRRNNNNRNNYGGNNIDDVEGMASLGVDQPDANLADFLVKN